MTKSQRAMMAAKAAEGRASGPSPKRGISPQIRGNTQPAGGSPKAKAKDAAKSMSVSATSVESAIKVRRDAAEEVADAVDSGEITLNAASQLAKNVPDKDEQKKAVAGGKKEPGEVGARLRRANSATRGTRSPSVDEEAIGLSVFAY